MNSDLNAKETIYESDRLTFRRIGSDDYEDLAKMLTDPEVTAAWEHTFTRAQILEWIDRQLAYYRRDGIGYFAALSKDNSEFVGQMGLHRSELEGERILEVCYMLKRSYWNNGYALEGANAWLAFARTRLNADRVFALIRPMKKPSIRVAEKAGMIASGSFVKRYGGKDMEHMIYVKDWR